jgi:hypothetical protein
MYAQDGDWRQAHPGERSANPLNEGGTEEDVTDKFTAGNGYERDKPGAVYPQAIRQVRLLGPAESQFIHPSNGRCIGGRFTADRDVSVHAFCFVRDLNCNALGMSQ